MKRFLGIEVQLEKLMNRGFRFRVWNPGLPRDRYRNFLLVGRYRNLRHATLDVTDFVNEIESDRTNVFHFFLATSKYNIIF